MTVDVGSAQGRSQRPRNRQQLIAEEVMNEGTVRIEALAEKYGISLMTAHRDIDALAARGVVRKSRGAVTALPSSLVEASDVYRRGRSGRAKQALARAAMEWVQPGQAVILDDSTTTEHIVPLLSEKTPLTIITNFLSIITQLTSEPDITLVTLGGRFYPWANGFLGPMTIRAVRELHADLLILSSSAISDGVAFHQTEETVATKRAMFAAAEQRIMLLDHTKFDKRALHALLPLRDFDVVIVDHETPAERVAELRDSGITVQVASYVPAHGGPES